MDAKLRTAFINSWGEMGSLWGLNSSMARVHALLLVAEKPTSLDKIARQLRISRGNASMCLKELRNWGVIRRVKVPGDRRDYYLTEPDVWQMFFAIGRERKRRELDPLLAAVRQALAAVKGGPEPAVAGRLEQMDELLTTLDRVLDQMLGREDQARSLLALLSGAGGKKG